MRQAPPLILISEDRIPTQRMIQGYLSDKEPTWEFCVADDEDAAIRCVRDQLNKSRPVDVIITDLDMKAEDGGIALIGEAQKLDSTVMAILYTGKEDILKRFSIANLGALDVVVKGQKGYDMERILEKARLGLRYRNWALSIGFLRRYFDSRFIKTLEDDRSLLVPKERQVTVAFWDVRGFTSLCEKLPADPDLVAGFLKDYCEQAARTIFAHGGVLDKFIGDGVMGLFGLLDQTEEGQKAAAIDAVEAAKALWLEFPKLAAKWQPKWEKGATSALDHLELGCGIHSGRALVGNLGTDFRDQFTAIGRNVNFAQRLESLAGREPGKNVLISKAMESHVRDKVAVRFYNQVEVKNVPGRHDVYFVVLDAL